jgi:hypothetical protein
MTQPIRIHPQNPKLFEFREAPRVLVTATEHYGAVMNRPFRYERYLADAAERGITLTRLFMLFRELQTPINPYSTCKPESPDYISPFRRVGPEWALDGELKHDLDQRNPEFFERLHGFVALASDYGVIVEVVLLSNVYNPDVWGLQALNPKNNVNGFPDIPWYETMTTRHSALFERQAAHVRQIVSELNRYDNVIYEICNEPFGNSEIAGAPKVVEINDWLKALIGVVRDTEAGLQYRHLIAGQQSCSYSPHQQASDESFQTFDYDVVNMHPLPNTTYGGKSYQLGDFMSKQLMLRTLRDFNLATYAEAKPLNQDEDNIASEFRNVEGWTIHRKRAWVTVLTGAHYDYIDFSILPYLETGTPESQRCIRSWIGYLARFIHTLDLARVRPLDVAISEQPAHTLETVFGVPDEDIVIYLADERELTGAHFTMLKDSGVTLETSADAGQPISGALVLDLPEGEFDVACFDPATGLYSPGISISGGAGVRLALPTFRDDVVVRLRRK